MRNQDLYLDGCQRLARAVLLFAIEKHNRVKYLADGSTRNTRVSEEQRTAAQEFLNSKNVNYWSDLAGIDVERLKRRFDVLK